MSTAEPAIKFSNEDSKATLRAKVGTNLANLIELTRSTVRSSESNELFRACFKSFVHNDPLVANTCDRFAKVEIVATQLNYQVEAIRTHCTLLSEVCSQIQHIHKKQQN